MKQCSVLADEGTERSPERLDLVPDLELGVELGVEPRRLSNTLRCNDKTQTLRRAQPTWTSNQNHTRPDGQASNWKSNELVGNDRLASGTRSPPAGRQRALAEVMGWDRLMQGPTVGR